MRRSHHRPKCSLKTFRESAMLFNESAILDKEFAMLSMAVVNLWLLLAAVSRLGVNSSNLSLVSIKQGMTMVWNVDSISISLLLISFGPLSSLL